MATKFDLSIGYNNPDEIRDLYQGLLRAEAGERTELIRLGRLRATGYLTNVDSTSEYERTESRLTSLRLLATFCRGEMRAQGIEPW